MEPMCKQENVKENINLLKEQLAVNTGKSSTKFYAMFPATFSSKLERCEISDMTGLNDQGTQSTKT